MPRPPTDTDAAALVQRSLLFRIARQLFVSIDAAAGRSTVLPALTKTFSVATAGRLVLVASLTHAAIVTMIPLAQAPLWRYSFAATGLLIGGAALLLSRARRNSSSENA